MSACVKTLFDNVQFSDEDISRLLCLLIPTSQSSFYYIIDRTICPLDSVLEQAITEGNTDLAIYIINTGRLPTSSLPSISSRCCERRLLEVIKELHKHGFLVHVSVEIIVTLVHSQENLTKHTWDSLSTFLLENNMLDVQDRNIVGMIRGKSSTIINMLHTYNLLYMKPEWVDIVMKTRSPEIITTMIGLLEDDTILSSKLLHYCCNNFDVSRELINKGIDKVDSSTLRVIVDTGSADVLKLVLDTCVCDLSCLNELLLFACTFNKTSIVEFLLQDGRADPSCNNSECLVVSSKLDILLLYNYF